jgi:arabinofuranosyltransferase
VGLALLLAGTLLHARAGYFQDDLSGHARGSDDAYISYRYAQNLARGHGLVFNPGERVEGYSNLLYVLLLAPLSRVAGPDALYPISVTLNLLFAAGAWALFARLAARRLPPARAGAASLLFGLCPMIWLWAASGMETPLFLLLQIALWMLVDRAVRGAGARPAVLAAVVVFSVLARADGFVVPSLAVVYFAGAGRKREAVVTAAALAATLAALVAWRLSYYGYPLPNTYYAKVSGPVAERLLEGMLQLLGIVLHAGILPHVAALLVAAAASLKLAAPPGAPRIRFEVFLGLGWLAYWLYVGGDVFAERMLLILFPIGILLLLDPTLFPLAERSARVVVGLTALCQLLPLAVDTRFGYARDRYDRWVTLGRHLAQDRYAGRLLAVDAAGKIPFYSGLPVVDMLGLNDAHIAHLPAGYFEAGHNKYDPDYVLARRPELIADWVDPRLDLRFGLTREKYEAAGFHLDFLVFTRKERPSEPLVDVRGLDRDSAVLLVRRGYRYALLSRAVDGRRRP